MESHLDNALLFAGFRIVTRHLVVLVQHSHEAGRAHRSTFPSAVWIGACSLPLVYRFLTDFLLVAVHLFVDAVEIVELVQTILDQTAVQILATVQPQIDVKKFRIGSLFFGVIWKKDIN